MSKSQITTKGNIVPPPSARRVQIDFTHATAISISVIGTFNRWRPEAAPMAPLGDGRWSAELLLPPGIYEYQLLVDGKWIPDPRAAKTKPNAFGEVNSVLKV